MTANFVDQFGFNDEEFTDHDDSIGYVNFHSVCQCTTVIVIVCWLSESYHYCRATFDRIAEININIDAGQDSVSLFICIPTFALLDCISVGCWRALIIRDFFTEMVALGSWGQQLRLTHMPINEYL